MSGGYVNLDGLTMNETLAVMRHYFESTDDERRPNEDRLVNAAQNRIIRAWLRVDTPPITAHLEFEQQEAPWVPILKAMAAETFQTNTRANQEVGICEASQHLETLAELTQLRGLAALKEVYKLLRRHAGLEQIPLPASVGGNVHLGLLYRLTTIIRAREMRSTMDKIRRRFKLVSLRDGFQAFEEDMTKDQMELTRRGAPSGAG
ncbi:MAG: hypothetical protein M1816_006476 [Peltula sp. TS41687]|nr:MAG: hypothetical protein M1816_006476 [Peltula sp. TS41687]